MLQATQSISGQSLLISCYKAEQQGNPTSVWMVGPEKLAMYDSFSVTCCQTEPPDFWSSVSLREQFSFM